MKYYPMVRSLKKNRSVTDVETARGIRLSKQKTSNKIDGAGEPTPERKLSTACT
jgi:hypothetical protein